MSDDAEAVVAVRLTADEDADEEDTQRLAGLLRRELLDLDVSDVRRDTSGEVPAGARAVDVETLGTLIVTVANTAKALRALVGAVNDWLDRSSARKAIVELDGETITLEGLTEDAQMRLIEAWIARHAGQG